MMAAARRITQRVQERKAAKLKGQFQPPSRPLLALRNVALKTRRKLASRDESSSGGAASHPTCGVLYLSILGGRYHSTTRRAYWIVELDGNERRTAVATCDTPVWEGEDFVLPVHDPSSDLRLFLFDDEGKHNEKPIGRVILPLPSLCTSSGVFGGGVGAIGGRRSLLPRAPPCARRLVLRVMPIGTQHSDETLARFDEACPGVPGSGMVRPRHEIGTVEVLLRLKFDTPAADALGLLAAYAHAEPPGELEDEGDDEEGGDDEGGDEATTAASAGGGGSGGRGSGGGSSGGSSPPPPPKLNFKLLRLHTLRLGRCIGRPHLLCGVPCLGLPPVLYAACFHVPPYLLPWVGGGLCVANGALARMRRHEALGGFIFWESEVGESAMPRGPIKKLKQMQQGLARMQHGLGQLATALEKSQNLLNGSDPTVTAAATCMLCVACALGSLVLWLVPLPVLAFVGGMLGLGPFLADALRPLFLRGAEPRAAAGGGTRPRKGPASFRMMRNILARVPDGRDVAHRHFALEQVIEAQEVAAIPMEEEESEHQGGTANVLEPKPHMS